MPTEHNRSGAAWPVKVKFGIEFYRGHENDMKYILDEWHRAYGKPGYGSLHINSPCFIVWSNGTVSAE
jgi:hypothetical protein